jgi:hypothetical protein
MTVSLKREARVAGGVPMIENEVRARSVNATSHECGQSLARRQDLPSLNFVTQNHTHMRCVQPQLQPTLILHYAKYL